MCFLPDIRSSTDMQVQLTESQHLQNPLRLSFTIRCPNSVCDGHHFSAAQMKKILFFVKRLDFASWWCVVLLLERHSARLRSSGSWCWYGLRMIENRAGSGGGDKNPDGSRAV